jgi:hypothetical protein
MDTEHDNDAEQGIDVTCQVYDNIKTWPYVLKCREQATHEIVQSGRHKVGGYEYICDKHASAMEDGYGEDSIRLLPGFRYID